MGCKFLRGHVCAPGRFLRNIWGRIWRRFLGAILGQFLGGFLLAKNTPNRCQHLDQPRLRIRAMTGDECRYSIRPPPALCLRYDTRTHWSAWAIAWSIRRDKFRDLSRALARRLGSILTFVAMRLCPAGRLGLPLFADFLAVISWKNKPPTKMCKFFLHPPFLCAYSLCGD